MADLKGRRRLKRRGRYKGDKVPFMVTVSRDGCEDYISIKSMRVMRWRR